MFEIIGILFVGFIVWSIYKGMFKGFVKGHMIRSVDYAASQGVPRDFSQPIVKEVTSLMQAVKYLGKDVPGFKEKDVYEQNGLALKRMYNKYLADNKSTKVEIDENTINKISNKHGMTFVWVEPGSFTMGSPLSEIGRGEECNETSMRK